MTGRLGGHTGPPLRGDLVGANQCVRPFRMGSIKNIIFDWSGTLCDDFDVSFISTQHTIQHFGGPILTKKQYKEEFTLPVWKFYRKYIPKKISTDELDHYYFDHFASHAPRGKLFPSIPQILKLAKKLNIQLFVYSTVRQSLLADMCRQKGIAPFFKKIVGSVRNKERGLSAFCKQNKLKGSETLYVGDTVHDVLAAKRAGIYSAALLNGYHAAHRLLEAAPDFIWQDHGAMAKFLRRLHSHPVGNSPQRGSYARDTHPIPTVGALICNKGDIFLMQTHKWGHTFGIPGGKIKKGETTIKALRREIREETALTLKNIRWALVQDAIFSKEFYLTGSHFLLLNFYAESSSRKFRLNQEAESGFWVNPRTALRLNLNEPTRKLVELYLKNH